MRDTLQRLWPEIEWIEDLQLRDQVSQTWIRALDRSPLLAQVGRAELARVVVTGPARQGRFEVRAPARVLRFGSLAPAEPVLLELPLGRAPPQGGLLEVLGVLELPRGPAHGFDERTWLRRHGIYVVLHGDRWRLVGRRGGLGGLADRLRERLGRTSTPGLRGVNRNNWFGSHQVPISLVNTSNASSGVAGTRRATSTFEPVIWRVWRARPAPDLERGRQ